MNRANRKFKKTKPWLKRIGMNLLIIKYMNFNRLFKELLIIN